MITTLTPNQVFVFGSNKQGFHGAGSAGFACRGDSTNTWRNDTWFLDAIKSPQGSSKRIGKYAVYGIARGFQTGLEGMSYAIQTIESPGQKRSTSLAEIQNQVVELYQFAKKHPEFEFLVTRIGEGYSGYTHEEMLVQVWNKSGEPPANIVFLPS